MFEIIFLVLAVGLMAFAWWWLGRRRRELLGDDGKLLSDPELPDEPQALTREALVHRSRAFDPTAWDDSPDPSAAADQPIVGRPSSARPIPTQPADDEDEAPSYFDREFLERQRSQRARDSGTDLPPPD